MKFSRDNLKNTALKVTEFVISGSKKLCHSFRCSRLFLFAVSLVICTILTVFFSGVTLAYEVEYNGTVVAQIKSKSDYSKVLSAADSLLYGESFKKYALTPKFHLTVTCDKNINSPREIAVGIMEQTASINRGTALKVDGEVIACVGRNENLGEYLDDYLANYIVGGEVVSEFVKNVETIEGYYPSDIFFDMETVKAKISALDVKTVQTIRKQKSIPYTSVTRKSDTRVLGDIQRIVTGVNGVKETIETVEMLNGKTINTTIHSETIISQPVQEVIVVGTKRDTSVNGVYVSQLGCVWPLKRVSNQVITAYYGDGRNHKGIDIASPSGTPIYAAQAGTVVTSRYSNSYGYYVVIDHGNGYKTLYAHCSKLLVSVGEAVYQGEVIALVGTTGISTGNHLHFEVQKDGVQLNPASFIGL